MLVRCFNSHAAVKNGLSSLQCLGFTAVFTALDCASVKWFQCGMVLLELALNSLPSSNMGLPGEKRWVKCV